MVDKSMSLVILIYCTNFCHQRFALELSCFSMLGMDNSGTRPVARPQRRIIG